MKPDPRKCVRGGFCLTELLIVLGLISILISLLLPVIRKVRAAANSTACLSNVRQMGMAYLTYVSDNKGRVPDYMWSAPGRPDIAWQGYWLGVLETYKVKGGSLLCPAANEAPPVDSKSTGYGNVKYAWTGKASSAGTTIRYTKNTYREGSY